MEYKYKATPMLKRSYSTKDIMNRLLVVLLIVYAFGLFNAYKWGKEYFINGIILLVVAEAVSFACEIVYALLIKEKPKKIIKTFFPAVTPLIIVLTVSVNTSPYAVAVCTALGVIFGKLVFGGFGQNVFNPAAVARAILATSFAGKVSLDAISSPTITTTIAGVNWVPTLDSFTNIVNTYGGVPTVLTGTYFGAMGETSSILLIVLAIVLSIIDVIDWRIPATYIGVLFAGSSFVALTKGLGIAYPLTFISTGGALFGAVFMLTDPVTNPQSRPGKIVFAALAALITTLIRYLGNLPEGVVFSILICNLLSPAIDKLFTSKQIESQTKNACITFGVIIFATLCAFLAGNSITASESQTSIIVNSQATAGGIADMDLKDCEATVLSVNGNVYHVSSKGYSCLSGDTTHEPIPNEFDITIENGAIVSIKCSKFSDSEGVGDIAISEDYLYLYEGKTKDDHIDTCTGATFTSRSILAAVQAALKEAK